MTRSMTLEYEEDEGLPLVLVSDDEDEEVCTKGLAIRSKEEQLQKINSPVVHKLVVPFTTMRKWYVGGICTLAVAVVVVICIISSNVTRSVSPYVHPATYNRNNGALPAKLAEWGWMDTVEYYRQLMSKVSHEMKEQEMAFQKAVKANNSLLDQLDDYHKYTVDISPLYDAVWEAVDTIGVKGLVFDVFTEELNDYYELEESEECLGSELHGYNCAHYGVWWFYHYTGGILGEKLVKEGAVMWDPMTGEECLDWFEIQERIHEREELPAAWEMSFHVQHGLLQYYALYNMPDMQQFPTPLVEQFCGRWVHDNTQLPNGKNIGFSCTHGFGHMVFVIVAAAQIDSDGKYPLSARRQIKPNSGLELDHQSMCRVHRICNGATELGEVWAKNANENGSVYATNIANRCPDGVTHSMKLMAATEATRKRDAEVRKRLAQYYISEGELCAAELDGVTTSVHDAENYVGIEAMEKKADKRQSDRRRDDKEDDVIRQHFVAVRAPETSVQGNKTSGVIPQENEFSETLNIVADVIEDPATGEKPLKPEADVSVTTVKHDAPSDQRS